MNRLYSWDWVEAQVAATVEVWDGSVSRRLPEARQYGAAEQQQRERAYDEALEAVERELKRGRIRGRTRAGGRGSAARRRETQDRVTAAFARFSAAALDLNDEAIELLTDDFLPVGTQLARWARQFDESLSMADIIQAARNAWTACGLQPLLGERVRLTPAILGYSLLYPYSDNYLDGAEVTAQSKLRFSQRFRERLEGEATTAANQREAALWALVELIEGQYPRAVYPDVFDCLLAIHRAQEQSIAQVKSQCTEAELLRVSCAKGGSSVLADGCLARGWLNEEESRVSFEWGVVLQLGDDLQDVREDMLRGSVTLFSGPAARGELLDDRVRQLLTFSERVSDRIARLPSGSATLKGLLRMSWRSLILMAVAASHEYFSAEFLAQAERFSPFRFGFLRERREKLTGRQGLYAMLFEAFLEPREGEETVAAGSRSGVAAYALSPEIPPA
jgi:hypothetical protein